MQPLKQLTQSLRTLADREHCIFAPSDLASAVPECDQLAVLLSRATKAGLLKRVCRGIYFYPVPDYSAGHLLFHAAARLRAVSSITSVSRLSSAMPGLSRRCQ
jgi:predicted transcriptional regulator of viral defense system